MVPLGAEGVLLVAFAPVGRGLRFYLSPRSWVTGRNAGAQRRYRRACAAAAPLLSTGFRQSRLGRSPWPWCCLSRVSGCGLPWFCELVSLPPHVPLQCVCAASGALAPSGSVSVPTGTCCALCAPCCELSPARTGELAVTGVPPAAAGPCAGTACAAWCPVATDSPWRFSGHAVPW